jgi:hypothetical protein
VLTALPALPDVSCSPAVAALGGIALAPVCGAASVTSGATGIAGSVAGFGVNTVLNALGSWVSSGATWLLQQIGAVLTATTSIDLTASWFTSHYQAMAALAGVVVVPLLLLGIVQSVYRQNASALVRSVLVNVPLAVLLTAVAVKLVSLGLALTDAMSNAVASGAGLDAGHFMTSVIAAISTTALANAGAPAFLTFLGSLALVFGALLLWIELVIRSAAVYVAVLFLPLALASLAWPAISHWCRRLADTLVALILGKFVIVSVLSLAAGALNDAGGTDGGGFSAVVGGAALLFLSALAPWTLFRLLPFLEAGAVGHLEEVSRRAHHTAVAPMRSLSSAAMSAAGVSSVADAATVMVTKARGRGGGSGGGGGVGGVGGGVGGTGSGPRAGGGGGGYPTRGSGPGPRPEGGGPGPEEAGGASPDMGPSSIESTGVGTATPPAHGIPAYPAHPAASARARQNRSVLGLDGTPMEAAGPSADRPGPVGSGSPIEATAVMASASGGPPGRTVPPGPMPVGPRRRVAPGELVPLPRQSGTTNPDFLSRDHLGPRLIAGRQPPAYRPPEIDPDA